MTLKIPLRHGSLTRNHCVLNILYNLQDWLLPWTQVISCGRQLVLFELKHCLQHHNYNNLYMRTRIWSRSIAGPPCYFKLQCIRNITAGGGVPLEFFWSAETFFTTFHRQAGNSLAVRSGCWSSTEPRKLSSGKSNPWSTYTGFWCYIVTAGKSYFIDSAINWYPWVFTPSHLLVEDFQQEGENSSSLPDCNFFIFIFIAPLS